MTVGGPMHRTLIGTGLPLVMVGTRAYATKEEAKAAKDAATECQESF